MSVSTRQLMGIGDPTWQRFSESNANLLKTYNVQAGRFLIFLDWWNNNIAYEGFSYQPKTVQNAQWMKERGMKFWLECFSFTWMDSGWEQMKAEVILNINGRQDAWINGFSEIIRQTQPAVVGILNEPPGAEAGGAYGVNPTIFYERYRQFVNRSVDTYKAIVPNALFTVGGMPFWNWTLIKAKPIDRDVIYDFHLYYSYNNSNPDTWGYFDRMQQAYWHGQFTPGIIDGVQVKAAKDELHDMLTYNLQGLLDMGKPVVMGEIGASYLNPNWRVFVQDICNWAKSRNMGLSAHAFTGRQTVLYGLLNVDEITLNDLGKLWLQNMDIPSTPQYRLTVLSTPLNIPFTLTKMV